MDDDGPDSTPPPEATGEEEPASHLATLARLWWRPHLYLFLVLNGALSLINWAVSDYWWGFWPLFITLIPLACHYFLVKSLDPDLRWIEQRGMWIKSKSYDIDHMRKIEESYRTGNMPGRHKTDHGAGEKNPED